MVRLKQVPIIVVFAIGVAMGAGAVVTVMLALSNLTDGTIEHSEAYLDAETSMLLALSDIFGQDVRPGNPYVSTQVEHAYIYQRLFHFEHAELGDYVQETDDFYPWLRDFMQHRSARASGEWDEYRTELEQRSSHAQAQIEAAIYDPNSNIGKAFREMEEHNRAVSGSGSEVYWEWLVKPYIHGIYLYTPNAALGGVSIVESNRIADLQREYEGARRRGEMSEGLFFGDFLAENEYLPELMSR